MAARAEEVLFESVNPTEPISVYVHIPFCDRLCWFCACHTKHTLKYQPVARYVDVLVHEILRVPEKSGFRPKLKNLHFGGGSPSMLRPDEAHKLRFALSEAFELTSDAEISVEVDPNDASDAMMEALSILGMTRASLGVQDFDPIVQKAINRPQSYEDTADLVNAIRDMGITSLNIDAIYGLPHQTRLSISETVSQILSLDPDRLALFGYAHVPGIKKHQNMIDPVTIPDDAERLEQSRLARSMILEAGYEAIGFDHFAKPDDSLSAAKKTGTLRRNFQGYTTDQASVLLGLGASSISKCDGAYVQNIVSTGNYMRFVEESLSVAERGFVLGIDDQIRAFIIQSIMCDFRFDTAVLSARFGERGRQYVDEVRAIALDDPYGICSFNEGVLEILPDQYESVRLIASQFDAYLDIGASTYSKAV